jgi:hypothetical protein
MFSPYYYHNYKVKVGMSFLNKLWWKLMPSTTIKVAWPNGTIIGDSDPRHYDRTGAAYLTYESADPNDHYRPYMETNVGRQGWDWDWTMMDNDVSKNTLTIKFRKGKEHWATMIALRWS